MKAIGIDLGGKSIKAGIVEGGKVLEKVSRKTNIEGGYLAILKDIIALCRELLKEAGDAGFVGIGSPGIIANGKVDYSYNICWSGVPLEEDLKNVLSRDVKLANDAVCAALAEFYYGAGKDFTSMAILTLGTGVGGAYVDEEQVKKALSANITYLFGHITVVSGGLPCTCDRHGCLEAYASASAVEKRAAAELGKELSAKEVFELARENDEAALRIVNDFNRILGDGIVSICNVLRPEAVVIGGGLSASGDLILPYINEKLAKEVYGFSLKPVIALPARLGNDAGIIGAANIDKYTGE
ncbi:MAG: ROK family protein [Clostridiales bacterium]|jgi:predicted NBD/HSP70 family sugar kinase|nr:ROK family protein [Clostridiales bacterium]